MKGLVLKGIGGFYYVDTEKGLIEARGRKALKKDGDMLTVGDVVDVEITDNEKLKGVINTICERKNRFIRPAIANVDTFVVTFACTKPQPSFSIIDRFIVMAEMSDIDIVIAINKCDLVDAEERERLKRIYDGMYPVVLLNANTGEGIEELEGLIQNKTAAFAGPSGVGKSTIINRLIPHANMETQNVSEKTERGRHTTRHVEIFHAIGGGKVFDTPGFTSFDIMEADEENLEQYYVDIARYRGKCYYDNCRHIKEPDCAVRKAVKDGLINRLRYDSYVANILEIREKKAKR